MIHKGAVLIATALAMIVLIPSPVVGLPPARTAERQRDDDEIAQLKKRVADLEAQVAELRKALRRAGGEAPDPASEVKNISEVAKLRAADLLQRAQNTHALLGEVMNPKMAAGPARNAKINELGNNLGGLWITAAGYGIGRDPYLDNIQMSDSGFSRPKLGPNFGISGSYDSLGLPRLQERYLEASGVKGKAADTKIADFKKLVQAYSNPALFPHRELGDRIYNDYRQGKGLDTAQFAADMKALNQWLTDLEAALGQVPTFFEKAPAKAP
jgi:hypothetical protein